MKTTFFLFCILISLAAFSQKSDYVVKHDGDTVFGKVKLLNKKFRITELNTNVIELNASDVKKVHSPGIRFNTVVPCKLHMYTDNLIELRKYEYESQDIDTVMVLDEVYSTPKMNLYWGVDFLRQQYYFYKTPTDSLPIQLYVNYTMGGGVTAAFEKDIRGQDSKAHLEVQKGYVNQLRLIMGDCNKISEGEWEMLDYRIYSLKALIKRYNKCK